MEKKLRRQASYSFSSLAKDLTCLPNTLTPNSILPTFPYPSVPSDPRTPSALVLAGGEQTKNLRERSGSATEKEKPEPCEISDHRPSTPPHLGRSQCRPFGAGPCPSGERPGPWPPAGGGCGVQEGHTQRAPEARRPVT